MKKYIIFAAIVTAVILSASAQHIDPVLMTINKKEVRQSEFEYMYNKNKLQQIEPQNFDEYVDMFVVFKLKVADAEAAGIDTTATFRNEYNSYCAELARAYTNPDTNPDYINLTKEYHDGILLFEISNRNVWERAYIDKSGLEKFSVLTEKTTDGLPPRFKGYLISAVSDSVAASVERFLSANNVDTDTLAPALRRQFGDDIKVELTVAAKGDNPAIDYMVFGAARPANQKKWKAWTIYRGKMIDTPEDVADMRGQIILYYQQELEKQWVNELRTKYEVNINREILNDFSSKHTTH